MIATANTAIADTADTAAPERPALVVLISGRGSNLAALLAAALPVRFAAVISNRADAAGLAIAARHGIPTRVIDHRAHPDRAAFDDALAVAIDAALADAGTSAANSLIVLAGFMRIFTAEFTQRQAGRMINIHPSLLPAFTGLHTHERALEAGVRIHGCTVHLVTAELDHGPIIAQAAVPVLPDDDAQRLAERVLRQEHVIYPAVVRAWAEGRLSLGAEGRLSLGAEGRLRSGAEGSVVWRGPVDPDGYLRVPA